MKNFLKVFVVFLAITTSMWAAYNVPWVFTDNTGNYETVILPTTINPTINGRAFQNGDAIGYFFNKSGSLVCAGYTLWDGSNINIAAWGDDENTPEKDGFSSNEPMTVKVWDGQLGTEHTATVTYSSGTANYSGGFAVLGSLTAGLAAPVLNTPANNATGVALDPTFTWSTVQEATHYKFEISENSDFQNILYSASIVGVQTTLLTTLDYYTTYYWRVQSVNVDVYGGRASASFQTIPEPIDAPQLSLPINGATNVSINTTISWLAASGATSYDVLVASDEEFSNVILNTNVATLNTNLNQLGYETTYFWKVKGKNAQTESEWSSVWNFTTELEPLAAPELDSPANNATNQNLSVTLSWLEVNNATSYIVQAANDDTFANPILNYETNQLTYLLEQLSYNTNYFWRVMAKNSLQTSPWSEIWNFTTKLEPLAVPQLTAPSDDAINIALMPTLQWTGVNNATSYDVQLWVKSNSQMIVNTNVATLTHNGFTLDYYTEYEWKVRAKNAQQTGEWSATSSFTTVAPTLPVATTGDATNITYSTVTLAGSVVGGSGTINARGIIWGTTQNLTIESPNKSTNGNGLGSFTNNTSDLQPETTYYYRAYATSQYGTGYGDVKSFTTLEAPPFTISVSDQTTCKNVAVYLGSDLEVSGGSGDFSYSWSPSNVLDDATKENPVFMNPLTTTVFTLTVTDEETNKSETEQVTITVTSQLPSVVFPSLLSRKLSYPSFNLNSLITQRSGTAPFVDVWYNSSYEELSSTVVDPPLGLTKYYHRTTDATGCTSNYKRIMIYTSAGKEISTDNIVFSENYTIAAVANPSPADKNLELSILLENESNIDITIMNVEGKEVYRNSIVNSSVELFSNIDVQNFSQGAYFIYIRTNDDLAVLKFIKI